MHVCKKCKPITKTQEWKDQQEQLEIHRFLEQKIISKKNKKRLKALMESPNAETANQAQLVFEVACIQYFKKRRIRLIRAKHPELYKRLVEAGLLYEVEYSEDVYKASDEEEFQYGSTYTDDYNESECDCFVLDGVVYYPDYEYTEVFDDDIPF